MRQSTAIEAGKIGELICLLRLCKINVQAELVHLGAADIVAFVDNRPLRIQVKSSHIKRNGGNSDSPGYQFCVAKGASPKLSLTDNDCDIVALVGIPQERVLFAPVSTFSEIKTKRLKTNDFEAPHLEWLSWCDCLDHYGLTQPHPNSPLALDQLYSVPGDQHPSP